MSSHATIHRHGSLHQQNKSHKSRKATKGAVNRKAGGRMVADPSEQEEQRKKNLKAASSIVNNMTKEQRRLQQRQKLNQRRQQLVHDKRIGSNHGPPKIVVRNFQVVAKICVFQKFTLVCFVFYFCTCRVLSALVKSLTHTLFTHHYTIHKVAQLSKAWTLKTLAQQHQSHL